MLMRTMEARDTDKRLELLEERVGERFDHVDAEFRRFEQVDARFQRLETDFRELRLDQKAGVKELRGEIQAANRELRDDLRAMQRNMLFGFFGLASLFLTYAGFQLS